jgi:formylglycine-generating enzyme required for sulfatase activity
VCTYSATPLGREAYPVNCVSWSQARAFCQAEGGDLPFEVEWEYATAQYGRTYKTPYPWGGNETTVPTCSQAVFGRAFDASSDDPLPCLVDGVGPLPVNRTDIDVSIALGIDKLAGNVTEWVRDSVDSLGSNCWMEQPLHMPTCKDPSQPNSCRGGSWSNAQYNLYYGVRSGASNDGPNTGIGLRCVRAGAAPASGGSP